MQVRSRMKKCSKDTLFVFTDQALGPWVPLAAQRPHVIHCHDFLAQKSAQGEIKENPTSATGKKYQEFIRTGYKKGRNFISVSKKTQEDLHRFLDFKPVISEEIYNGLNPAFKPQEPAGARQTLGARTGLDLMEGYILHIGGNQWYKNRVGVIEIYNAWRSGGGTNVPLLLIGAAPSVKLQAEYERSPYKSDIHLLTGMEDKYIPLAYSGCVAFLFPSLAEGFGWPIAEAMASGAPVITTDEAPMTEVAGNAAFLVPRRPLAESAVAVWASEVAKVLERIVTMPEEERKIVTEKGYLNAKRFNAEKTLLQIETIYKKVLQTQGS